MKNFQLYFFDIFIYLKTHLKLYFLTTAVKEPLEFFIFYNKISLVNKFY